MATTQEMIDRTGVEVDEHLDRQVTVPVLTGMQRQGDVIVVPADVQAATTPVPTTGVPVVRGENGGNTHLLLSDGPARFDGREASASSLTLGVLTVPTGAVAWLAHPEHGFSGIGPGTFEVRRQREQADEIRMVAD